MKRILATVVAIGSLTGCGAKGSTSALPAGVTSECAAAVRAWIPAAQSIAAVLKDNSAASLTTSNDLPDPSALDAARLKVAAVSSCPAGIEGSVSSVSAIIRDLTKLVGLCSLSPSSSCDIANEEGSAAASIEQAIANGQKWLATGS